MSAAPLPSIERREGGGGSAAIEPARSFRCFASIFAADAEFLQPSSLLAINQCKVIL
jgi:hypothetical protein